MVQFNSSNYVEFLLPAHDEEVSLAATIGSIRKIIPDAKILVVDNASKDRTYDVAKSLGVRVVREPRKGKGHAFKRGVASLQKSTKIVVLIDADNTYGVENVSSAIEEIEMNGYGMIVGTRVIDKDQLVATNKPFRFGHSQGNKLLTRLTNYIFPVDIKDSLSGWRVMSRGFVRSFPANSSGFELETELNAHAFGIGSKVGNIDVRYVGREYGSASKLNTYRDGLRILKTGIQLFLTYRPRFALGVFAAPTFLAGLFLTVRALVEFMTTGLVSHFPSLIAGVSLITCSAILWLTGMVLNRLKIMHRDLITFQYRNSQE